MKLYGDLLRVLPLNDNAKLSFIKTNIQIKSCSKYVYFLNIFNHFVDYEFMKLNKSFHKYIFKIKNYSLDSYLPLHVTHLKLNCYCKSKNSINKLPTKLKVLIINSSFDSYINFEFPLSQTSLTHLMVHNFRIVDPILPKSLLHLKIGYYTPNKILILPPSLISLDLRYLFNKNFIYEFPHTLRFLTIISYNISNVIIPPNLIYLCIKDKLDYKINLPSSLKYIKLCDYENLDFPSTLTHAIFYNILNLNLKNLPCNLSHLKIKGHCYDNNFNLPQNLKCLMMGNFDFNFNEMIKYIPSSLTHIELPNIDSKSYPYQPIPKLNNKLKLFKTLPNLTHIICSSVLDYDIFNKWPNQLSYLKFREYVDLNKLPKLPSSLRYLELKKIENNIENNISIITYFINLFEIDTKSKQNKLLSKLPETIKHIKIGSTYLK
jgi:hypothetical protein